MRILCTGGAGYIGSILVERLLMDDHEVTVLDSFAHRQASLAHLCAHRRLEIIRGDCRDVRTMKMLMKTPDVFIPLAALVGAPLCNADPVAAASTNFDAIWRALEFSSRDQRVIYPNTNSGYGVGAPGQECTEETPMAPISIYGRTKTEAEAAVLNRGNAVVFRLATVFGMSPRMRLDLLVNDFVHRAVVDRAVVLFEAHFRRNFIHVRDVASAFVHALDNFEAMRDRPYNVGLSDANLSKLELCERIAAHVPGFAFVEAPIGEDPDKRDYVVSNARIEATGWRPEVSLDDGIRELLKGYAMIRNGRYGNV